MLMALTDVIPVFHENYSHSLLESALVNDGQIRATMCDFITHGTRAKILTSDETNLDMSGKIQ